MITEIESDLSVIFGHHVSMAESTFGDGTWRNTSTAYNFRESTWRNTSTAYNSSASMSSRPNGIDMTLLSLLAPAGWGNSLPPSLGCQTWFSSHPQRSPYRICLESSLCQWRFQAIEARRDIALRDMIDMNHCREAEWYSRLEGANELSGNAVAHNQFLRILLEFTQPKTGAVESSAPTQRLKVYAFAGCVSP